MVGQPRRTGQALARFREARERAIEKHLRWTKERAKKVVACKAARAKLLRGCPLSSIFGRQGHIGWGNGHAASVHVNREGPHGPARMYSVVWIWPSRVKAFPLRLRALCESAEWGRCTRVQLGCKQLKLYRTATCPMGVTVKNYY
eukprot:4850689-Prymnesium_polylepis.1